MASVKWALSYEVEHLLVRVRIILNSWTHADDNSPRGVGSKHQNWVVDSSELRVDDSLHLVPLVHLESVVSDGSRQVSSGVTMKTVAIRQLRLVVLTIWLDEGLNVSEWLLNFFLHSIHEGEVSSLGLEEHVFGSVGRFKISHLF